MLRICRPWANKITTVLHSNKDYLKFSAGYSKNHAHAIYCTALFDLTYLFKLLSYCRHAALGNKSESSISCLLLYHDLDFSHHDLDLDHLALAFTFNT